MELKDFNIAAEAGGAGKGIVKTFVRPVQNGTLEIRFQWAGRGTNALPERGVYGPLVSAISAVNPSKLHPHYISYQLYILFGKGKLIGNSVSSV